MHKDKQLATMVNDYMVRNLGKRLTIPHLCREFGTNRNTLQQAFKNVYRRTVHEHVLHKKLDKANELIKCSDLPLDIIMYRVGFTSERIFIWRFENKFQITPLELMGNVRPRRR